MLEIATDEAIALRRFAKEYQIDPDQAARFVLREYLIASGYLELEHELDEDTETVGEA
ncbi:hypothetical protein [Aerobium aerolatum]|uniref:Uncharacterized protein n=1 Tax=Aquamicrobium aerolatum DSM 21857 TaxID=1121003 RepID=A0A1I3SJ40_9HYPH|nr:hypothetical protein [Aquamicrobium aerolatum]SFJ57661.1 hypothetical protein SAMN03080618_03367 [Aquamicrobium aerolatum DSM 21857]